MVRVFDQHFRGHWVDTSLSLVLFPFFLINNNNFIDLIPVNSAGLFIGHLYLTIKLLVLFRSE